MDSVMEPKNSSKRKALEEEKCLLQLAVVMRQRTGQPDSEKDKQALQRVSNLLANLKS